MLGLRGKLSLGARRVRFAGSGFAPILLTLSAGLLLAACQVPQHLSKTASTPQTQPTEASKSIAAPKPTPLATTPAVAHGDTLAPTALRLSGDPKELLGLDYASIRRTLGNPAQVRHEFTAQVWQYVTGDCVVDLYLYDQDGGLKVTYVEARSRTAETTPTTRCLKSLLERPTASAQ
jgi:hypothetical protein